MKEDLFTNLPTEMVIDILSRLPISSIIMYKIVCKSWRELVENIEFAKYHLSKAASHIAVVFQNKMFEFVDEHHFFHQCKNIIVSNLSLPHPGVILGSVNGLHFWCNGDERSWSHDLFVCNPITREYMKLPPPPLFKYEVFNAGVGVSKIFGQYKIVRILKVFEQQSRFAQYYECQLLTLGTRSWRSFSVDTQFQYSQFSMGAYLNGNLHWLEFGSMQISCFDLEMELFTSFSSPLGFEGHFYKTLSVVGDRLCLCDSLSLCDTVIWFMNEYGDEKSWTKEFVIIENLSCCVLRRLLFPIKVFINGDLLIAREYERKLFYYSKTNNAFHETGIRNFAPSTSPSSLTGTVIFTPSFLPLRNFLTVTENVCSFDVLSF